MKATLAVTLTLLAASTLATLAPTGQAVGTCTFTDPRCPALVCIGTSSSYGQYYYECDRKIGKRPYDPCFCCTCMPAMALLDERLLP